MSTGNEEKHREAYEGAQAVLRTRRPDELAALTGISLRSEDGNVGLEIPALGTSVYLSWPGLEFTPKESGHPLTGLLDSFPWRLIALHFLAQATGKETGEDWISYRELPDGLFYANTITREVEQPLAHLYGRDREAFRAAGTPAGAEAVPMGDLGLRFWPLPRVPVVFALWLEDEEFPAKVKVLYERSGARNLPLQDLRILADLLGGVLKRGAPGPG